MEIVLILVLIGAAYLIGRSHKKQEPITNIGADQGAQSRTSRTNRRLNQKRPELENIALSDEQRQLFEILENTNTSAFITGKAGTGKSLLLQYFRAFTKKNVVVVAPTGVAALNIDGQTIHSLFRLPPALITKEKREELKLDSKTEYLLCHVDTVVIDEISMVRVDVLEAIDYLLKKARDSDLPFGGVQIAMFGDLFQLPPVVSSGELQKYFADTYGGYYCFNADCWKSADLQSYELSHNFRQRDQHFIDILNSVRGGYPSEDVLLKLNARADIVAPVEGAITLATTNRTVAEINDRRLSALSGRQFLYQAEITGKLEESSFPTEEVLKLKKGAQVMMLKNDREKRWVNGTLGTIHSLSGDEIKVSIDGHIYTVSPEKVFKNSHLR